MTAISVVVPVYRSKDILPELHTRLANQLDALTPDWEVILVDDGSGDGTYDVMSRLHEVDERVKVVRFVRNAGQHAATLYGLGRASGDYVITMDDDLQNPPEEIGAFVEVLERGTHDLVIGRISGPKRHGFLRNIASRVVQRLVGTILNKPRDLALSSYRGMTRRAAMAMARYRGAHVYVPALMLDSVPAERICNVDVDHHARTIGKSTYNLRRMFGLVSYLLINHSMAPLRFVAGWGLTLSLMSVTYAAWVFGRGVWLGTPVPGFTSLAVLVSFLSGNMLLFIGIVGEYVGRLVSENSRREQFPVFEERL